MSGISVPKNYGFDTIICDYFYRSPFTTPNFTGATGAHKWHQGQGRVGETRTLKGKLK